MLACTVLTFAMCADPRVSGEITLGDLTVPIVWSHVAVRSCMDIGLQTGAETGLTTLETSWHSQETTAADGLVSGRLVAKLAAAHIDMTAFTWDHMTAADQAVLDGGYRATLWHEIGHVRTAVASIAAVNAEPGFSAAPADYSATVRKRGEAEMARVRGDQDEYDRVAEHGLRQDTLPAPLGGPDTIVECPLRQAQDRPSAPRRRR